MGDTCVQLDLSRRACCSVSVNASRGPIAVIGTLKHVTGCAVSAKWSGVGELGPKILSAVGDAANDLFKTFLIPLANKYLHVDVPTIELKDPKAGKAVYISFSNGTIEEEGGYGLVATNATALVQDSSNDGWQGQQHAGMLQ